MIDIDIFPQESDNEMVISDVDTGEFIAKKIIYDWDCQRQPVPL